MRTAIQSVSNTHRVQLGGETVECNVSTFQAVCDALVAKHGGVPVVTDLVPSVQPAVVVTASGVTTSSTTVTAINESGRLRAVIDAAQARENGFVIAEPVYSIGTRVNDTGVANARASQIEHEKKPSAIDACNDLIRQVRSEQRQDLPPVRLADLRMADTGDLVMPSIFQGTTLPITPKVFSSLFSKFPCASGVSYLNDCPTDLRAHNFNAWTKIIESAPRGDRSADVVIRTRRMHGIKAAYAAVTERYTSFDIDKIAEALTIAFPSDAKGLIDYDGERVRIEGLWHSDIKPEEFVAGEIFKAGVIIRSDDTGAGSVRVQSVIWRNLCKNLIILDKAIGVDVRLRHRGTTNQLAREFRKAFSEALSSVNAFRVAWTAARHEADRALIEIAQGTTREDLSSMTPEAVLPGLFNGILERELIPVRGRVENIVPKLLEMHRQDEAASQYGVSRASIINAFTRYAHVVETDPFVADSIRSGAGSLLSGFKGRAPAPIPYVAMT